jgi:hypothetical protein
VKKIITIFLLFIICIQCLPVKELGKCLFDSSFVEEDVCGKSLEKKETKDFHKEFDFINDSPLLIFNQTSSFYSRKNTDLFVSPVTDVTTPPPNA